MVEQTFTEQLRNNLHAYYERQYKHPLSLEFVHLQPVEGNNALFAINILKKGTVIAQYYGIAGYHFHIFLVRASISINYQSRQSDYGADVLFQAYGPIE